MNSEEYKAKTDEEIIELICSGIYACKVQAFSNGLF